MEINQIYDTRKGKIGFSVLYGQIKPPNTGIIEGAGIMILAYWKYAHFVFYVQLKNIQN